MTLHRPGFDSSVTRIGYCCCREGQLACCCASEKNQPLNRGVHVRRLCFYDGMIHLSYARTHCHPHLTITIPWHPAPCGLQGCKNRPAPFPGYMSYKATKPGLVSVLYLSIHYMVSLFISAPFYVLLVFIAMCAVFWLFWLSYQYLLSDWLERLVCVPHSFVFPWAVESSPLQFLALA